MDYFISMTDGKDPSQLIMEIEKSDVQEAKNRLLKYRDVFKMLQETKANGSRPVVVSDAEDVLTEHSRGYGNAEKPEDYLNAFSRYIQSNRNEIAALNIICTRPKDLTRKDLKDLRLTLDREGFTTQQLNTALYELTNEEIMADIISLIRRYAIGSTLISHEARIHRAVEKLRKKHNFSKQEQSWISRIEKYLLGESVMNIKVFDEDSRFASYGGFKKINKVFQNNLESIVLELNELRDDGITYHQYVTELTYILFLKMAKETGTEEQIPEKYRWDELKAKSGVELKKFYKELLSELGDNGTGRIREIYQGAATNIDEPKNLEKIIATIDSLDWYSAREEGLGKMLMKRNRVQVSILLHVF